MNWRKPAMGLAIPALFLGTNVGCATRSTTLSETQQQLEDRERQVTALESALEERERALSDSQSQVAHLSQELETARLPDVAAPPPATAPSPGDLLPASAEAGECYAKVLVPPSYGTETTRVLKREAGERIEVIPARYEEATERVLVKEASERLEVIPATYEWVEEQVLVRTASTRLEEVPAVYEDVEERILVKPAHTVWKKGRGPIERVDNATGEIMCLVDVPAEYKTIRKRVLRSPATTRTIEIPAEYKTVRKQVLRTPPSTRTIEIPAEYRTVSVRKLVEPARERRIAIPEEYDTVTKRTLVAGGKMEWRPILCETNASPDLVTQLQRSLQVAGHDPGPIDGRLGPRTMAAVQSFQQEKGLPSGQLTKGTLDALGVKLGR